ncbi:MAG: MFS transporter [Caldilineaceae bacterium]
MNNYRILLVTNSISFGTAGIYLPLMTLYLQGLGADLALISIILTSSAIVGLAGSYVWGRLADRVGRRKPFYVGGLAAAAIGYVWLSQANSIGVAWSARLWDGLSGAAVMTVGLTMLGDALAASPNKGRSMGLVRGSASLVWALGAFAGGRIADAFSLQTAFLICSGMFAAAALIALLLQETKVVKPAALVPAPALAPEQAKAAAGPIARPKIGLPVLFLAGVVLWGATDMASSTMWPNYLGSLGYSKTTISSLFSLAAFVEMPAMVVFGSLSDLIGRTIMLAAGGFVFALVQASYIFIVQNLPVLLGIQVVRGLGFGSYTASAMTFATEQGGHEDRGSNSGMFNAMSSAGMLTGTMLGGTVAQAFGFTTLYALCAVMATGAGACFLALRRRERRTRRMAGQVAGPEGNA